MIGCGRRPALLCKGRGGTKYALGVCIPAWACLRIEKNADCLRLTINGNSVFFWLVLGKYATPGLADKSQEETKTIPAHINDIKEILQLEDVPGVNDISRHCSLLKACFLETIHLDGEIRSARKVQGDYLIPTTNNSDATPSHKLWPGNYIHALHYLHPSDPKYFVDPKSSSQRDS